MKTGCLPKEKESNGVEYIVLKRNYMKKVIVFGNNNIAQMLYEDAKKRSPDFEICAFTVDEKYLDAEEFCGLPLVGFQDAVKRYPPSEYAMISAVDAFRHMEDKIKVYERIKAEGYRVENYISPLADVADSVTMGENNIVMAFAHLGVNGKMGNANMVRQSVYIGHDFNIGNGNTFSPGCTLGGFCEIEDYCYIALGATVLHKIKIERNALAGAGAVVTKNIPAGITVVGNPARPHEKKE